MMRPRLFGVSLATALMVAPSVSSATQRLWDFDVYLDDDRVGSHVFTVVEQGDARTVSSEARFDVKLLMMTVYRYEHRANESWRGDCLARLSAKTDDNGQQSDVEGVAEGQAFRLQRNDRTDALPPCVMTFAYWNPLILRQKQLLNPQTGEYVAVRIQTYGPEALPVADNPSRGERYHLDAGKFQIDLWYDDRHEWVALDSRLDNGHRLRYRLKNRTASVPQ